MKYTAELLSKAEEWVKEHGLIEYGGGQLQDFCAVLGINEKAKEFYKQSLTHKLHETLSMVATGYDKEETETEYRPNPKDPNKPTITKMKKKKVFYQPNVGAAIFLITNLDPEHYQNRQSNNLTLKDDTEKEMTLDEVKAEIERLKKIETKG